MSEPNPGTPTPEPSPAPAQPGAVNPPAPSTDVKPEAIPYARFKEINDKLREYERQEEERTNAARKAKEDEAKKKGEYERLIQDKDAELETLRSFKKAREAEEKAERDALLDKLSDEDKEIATELSTPKLRAYVEKQTKPTKQGPASARGAGTEPPDLSTAIKPGETAQQYFARMEKRKAG